MLQIASICSGGGILEQGAIAAGLIPIWGVELKPRIASLYQLNYPDSKILIANACDVNWGGLPSPDILHASPSCRHFSVAGKRQEHPEDIELGGAIGEAIAVLKPKIFTLENATPYVKSQSWAAIERSLQATGYKLQTYQFNFNRWGVPQKKRIRLIVVATRDTEPPIINVPNRTKWWYEEIKDLIPTFARSRLTKTQTKYLTAKTKAAIERGEAAILKRNQIGKYTPAGHQSDPCCWTVTATLATDQNNNSRNLFGDLVTPNGVFSLNTRALARIQTVPDTYKLTGTTSVDCVAIGDGVPSYFAEQFYSQIINPTRVQLNIYDALNSDRTLDSPKGYRDPFRFNGLRTRNALSCKLEDKLFPQKKSAEHLGVGDTKTLSKNVNNGYLQSNLKRRKSNTYKENYYRYYENGKQKSIYVSNALLPKVREAIASDKSIDEILILLRGIAKDPYSQNNLNKKSREGELTLSKPRRLKGEGTGYIIKKPIKRGNKTYNQYWFCYEAWSNNKRQKKSKYIPNRNVDQVSKLNFEKQPVDKILKAIGVLAEH